MSNNHSTYSKQVIEIADYIFKFPDKKREAILAHFGALWRKGRRTIERYYQQAKEYNTNRLSEIKKAKDEVLVQSAKESVRKGILTREQSMRILSKIAVKSNRDGERTRAIQQLSKMEGWEIQKVELTGKDGMPFNPEPLTIEIIDRTDKVINYAENTDNNNIQ